MSWAEWIPNRDNQVNTEAQVQHKRDELKEGVENHVGLALHICKLLLIVLYGLWVLHIFWVLVESEERVAEDAIAAEIANDKDWIDDFHEGVVAHASLSYADPRNHHLWMRLKLLIEHDS